VLLQDAGMKVTRTMIEAARRAEFDFHQKGRTLGHERFIPTSDSVIHVMLEAALKIVPDPRPSADPPPGGKPMPRVVVSAPPNRRIR
jgi:hypothetical protein